MIHLRSFKCCWFITLSNHRYQDSERDHGSGGGDEHPSGGIVRYCRYEGTMGRTNGEIFFKSLIEAVSLGLAMLSTARTMHEELELLVRRVQEIPKPRCLMILGAFQKNER